MRASVIATAGVLAAGLWWLPAGAGSTGAAAAATANVHQITGGQFEASGVVHVGDGSGVLFVDDGRHREIFWMPLAPDGRQGAAAVRIPLDADVTDPEGITFDGTHVYIVGSQSKKTGADGDGLVRFRFDPATRRADRVERIQGLKAWLSTQVPELRGFASKKGDKGLNIEAVAWDPVRGRLLLGLRAPVVDGQALVIPLALRDSTGPLTIANLEVGRTIRLALGGAGIRSLEYDGEASAFRLIAAASGKKVNGDFRLLEWDGSSAAPGREIATYAKQLKPEGFTPATVGGTRVGVVVFDTGSFTLMR
jgi:hypothetical protein